MPAISGSTGESFAISGSLVRARQADDDPLDTCRVGAELDPTGVSVGTGKVELEGGDARGALERATTSPYSSTVKPTTFTRPGPGSAAWRSRGDTRPAPVRLPDWPAPPS